MKKLLKLLILGLSVIGTIIVIIGCSSVENSEKKFDLEQFEIEMKLKDYRYKRQDLEYGGIFSPIAQYMILDDNIIADGMQYIFYDTDIIIYSYENNEEMEKEAATLNQEASQIIRDGNIISIEFDEANPHFYKKGKIIVQYIGEDEKIVKDLQEIMGEQFAGSE